MSFVVRFNSYLAENRRTDKLVNAVYGINECHSKSHAQLMNTIRGQIDEFSS